MHIAPEVHERLVAWRARFGLAIDNALNFLNNPDGIQGHNFSTQVAHVDDRRVLQGRLTLVRYNNEPQFFVADAAVFYGLIADILDRLVPQTDDETVDPDTLAGSRTPSPSSSASRSPATAPESRAALGARPQLQPSARPDGAIGAFPR